MTDDLKQRGKPDRDRINLGESWEVRDWCAHFKCTETKLREAVKAVGVMADKVEAYIKSHP